jgi:hypothetical protein
MVTCLEQKTEFFPPDGGSHPFEIDPDQHCLLVRYVLESQQEVVQPSIEQQLFY